MYISRRENCCVVRDGRIKITCSMEWEGLSSRHYHASLVSATTHEEQHIHDLCGDSLLDVNRIRAMLPLGRRVDAVAGKYSRHDVPAMWEAKPSVILCMTFIDVSCRGIFPDIHC